MGTTPQFVNLTAYREEIWRPADGRNVGLSVSGGRSSGHGAWHIVEANGGLPPGVVSHFCNTGKEDPRTLVFVDQIDRQLNLGIHWLEFDINEPSKVKRVTFETASRDGSPFIQFLYHEIKRRDLTIGVRPLPNPAQRTCTDQLKAKTWHRYARRHLGWPTDYYTVMGYRADEPKRIEKRKKRDARGWLETGKGLFVIANAGVTTEIKEDFWFSAPFDLELSSDHRNCDYCFMISTWKLKERMLIEALDSGYGLDPNKPPPRLQFWIACEERKSDRPGVFRKDRPSYREIWQQVCAGDMESCVIEGVDDRCGDCGA